MLPDDVTIAILAGGRSRRMGTDKSLLPLAGKPMLAHVIERVAPLGLPMSLITNTPEKHASFGLPMFSDLFPGQGALGGIYTAVMSSPSAYTLCLACDMPFLNPDLLRYLIDQRAGYDAVVPCNAGNFECLHAVYHRCCLPLFERQITEGNLRISDLYAHLKARLITPEEVTRFDPEHRSFMNLNTPHDVACVSLHSP